jgi:hypothetical protein
VSSHLHTPAALTLRIEPPVHIAPERVWRRYRKDKFPAPPGNRTPIFHPTSRSLYCLLHSVIIIIIIIIIIITTTTTTIIIIIIIIMTVEAIQFSSTSLHYDQCHNHMKLSFALLFIALQLMSPIEVLSDTSCLCETLGIP